MILRSLRLQQFRSYGDARFEFQPGVNVVVGCNGSGKTNLLEAAYMLMHGNSFRVADKDLVQYEQDWFRLDGAFDTQQRTIRYQLHSAPAKQVAINDGAPRRFMRPMRLPAVLFEPDMLRVLTSSPARRRELLDTLISQWFEDGAGQLRRYERILLQRNRVLKRAFEQPPGQVEDQLFAWDMAFAETAVAIEDCRARVVGTLNRSLTDAYERIARRGQTVELNYHSDVAGTAQAVLVELGRQRRREVARGHTLLGPHRSDFTIALDGQPAAVSASRGEQRSLILAIKQIEASELSRLRGTAPVLLLDDITGELDAERVAHLLQLVAPYQTIVTAAHHEQLLGSASHRHIALGMPAA